MLHEVREHARQHALGHLRALVDAVRAVREDLRLDDGHQAVLLAYRRVPRQAPRVVVEALRGGKGVADGEHRAPLGEPRALRVVLRAPLAEAVQAGRGGLAPGVAGEGHHAFVNLDARDDAFGLEQIDERGAVFAGLKQGLLEHDHAAAVLLEPVGGEQQLAVRPAVLLDVLHADAVEPLADRAGGFVRGEDALARD